MTTAAIVLFLRYSGYNGAIISMNSVRIEKIQGLLFGAALCIHYCAHFVNILQTTMKTP